MDNPKYLINISFVPMAPNGQQLVGISGVTYSMPTYSGEYFIASMPEVRISATGSSYTTALANLLLIATASTTYGPGHPPLSFS
jgi:hypothetical protein